MQLTPLRPRRRRNSVDSNNGSSGHDRVAPPERSADLSAIAGRIAGLIDGPVSEALVVILTELYGNALSRVLAAISETPSSEKILDRLCDDPLVGGLLVVHDLHPRPLAARVERALATVDRSKHAAPVALDRIEDDVVYVRLGAATGADGRTAIARAVAAAAPEISHVCAEVDVTDDRSLLF
jgi:hypothetical protein